MIQYIKCIEQCLEGSKDSRRDSYYSQDFLKSKTFLLMYINCYEYFNSGNSLSGSESAIFGAIITS